MKTEQQPATFPTIQEQIAQLEAAGWQAVTRTIWRSPLGQLYLGPHGAWKVAKEHGLLLTGERRYLAHVHCDLCSELGATYVKTRGRFWRLCKSCADLVEDAGLTVKPEIVRAMEPNNTDWENLRPDGTRHR